MGTVYNKFGGGGKKSPKYIECAWVIGLQYSAGGSNYHIHKGRKIVYNRDGLPDQNLMNNVDGHYSSGWHLICSGNNANAVYSRNNTYADTGSLMEYAYLY
jgi:hypothetical protein